MGENKNMTLDLTTGTVRDFEQLPEDTWIPARLIKREVIHWSDEYKRYDLSTDELLLSLFKKYSAVRNEEVEERQIAKELKSYQFSFSFKPLANKKYINYVVRGRTGIFLNFETEDGEFRPNKLAQFYLGAGGTQTKKGEKTDVDSILGNYVAFKVESNKSKTNGKVYQQVIKLRELTDEELIQAKLVENDIRKVEKAIDEAEKKVLEDTTDNIGLSQTYVLGDSENKEIPF